MPTMRTSETAEMVAKLCKIQAALKAPKNQYNSFGDFHYRSCEDILEAVKPLCVQEGLLLTISDEVILLGDRYYVKSVARLTDGEKEIFATAYARETETRPKMDAAQLTGSASSYARKYALNGLFCIDDTKDADTMKNEDTPKENPTPATQTEDAKFATLKLIMAEGAKKGVNPHDFADIIRMKYKKIRSSELTKAEVNDLAKNYMKYMSELVGG